MPAKTKVEYADYQITIYPTCPYMCSYCWIQIPPYNYRAKKMADPIKKAIQLTRSRKPSKVVVSFVNDPYQPAEEETMLTRTVLSILLASKHQVLILTKNPKLAYQRDLDVIKRGGYWLGSTITALWPIKHEPKAPSNDERLHWLRKAHEKGVKTWISMEPIIPNVTFPADIIKQTSSYVDWYVLGSLNYARKLGYKEDIQFYKKQIPKAIRLLRTLGKPFFIKKELRRKLGG